MRVKCLYIRNKEDGNKSVDHILNNQDYSNREIITDEEMKEMNEETNSLSNSPTQVFIIAHYLCRKYLNLSRNICSELY